MSRVLAALLMLQELGIEVHKKTLLVSQKLMECYQVNTVFLFVTGKHVP